MAGQQINQLEMVPENVLVTQGKDAQADSQGFVEQDLDGNGQNGALAASDSNAFGNDQQNAEAALLLNA